MTIEPKPANRLSASHWALYSVVSSVWSFLITVTAFGLPLGDPGPFRFAMGLSRENFEFAVLLGVPVACLSVFAGSCVLFLFSGRHRWLMWLLGLGIPMIAAVPITLWVTMVASV